MTWDDVIYRAKRGAICLAAIVLVVAVLTSPFVRKEIGHQQKYNALKEAGFDTAIKIKIDKVTTDAVSGSITVTNTGSVTWPQGKYYFAVGLFQRDFFYNRLQDIKFDNGTNRLVFHKDIQPGDAPWQSNFSIPLTQNRPVSLRFQVVMEGKGWFGQEVEIVVRE